MSSSALSQVRQNYDFLYRVYQIERYAEIESGTLAYVKIAKELEQLSFVQIAQLLQAGHIALLADVFQQTLVLSNFRGLRYAEIESQFPEAFLHKCRAFLTAFVPAFIHELEQFMKQSKLSYHLYARTCLMTEIQRLELILEDWEIPQQKAERDYFLQQVPAYVALMDSELGSPLMVQLWQTFGLLRLWHLDVPDHRKPLPAHSLKKVIEKYKMKDLGMGIYQALKNSTDKAGYKAVIEPLIQESLHEEPIAMVGRFEKKLREIVQGVMKWAVINTSSVEPVVRDIMGLCLKYAAISTSEERTLTVYILIQEFILGTQNLKYRLNDCTRGVAGHLADISDLYPSQLDTAADWALSAILDGIIEVYESFNLADNTLKSFKDAFFLARENLAHQTWLSTHSEAQSLLG